MTNYVANYVKITGEPSTIKKFWKKATTEPESARINNGKKLKKTEFEDIFVEMISKQYFSYNNLYECPEQGNIKWCIENWGNKWGAFSVNISTIDFDDGIIILYYDTTWAHSTPFWKKVTMDFEINVSNFYHDEGSNFCGESHYKNGCILKEKYYTNFEKEKDIFIKYASACGLQNYYILDYQSI